MPVGGRSLANGGVISGESSTILFGLGCTLPRAPIVQYGINDSRACPDQGEPTHTGIALDALSGSDSSAPQPNAPHEYLCECEWTVPT